MTLLDEWRKQNPTADLSWAPQNVREEAWKASGSPDYNAIAQGAVPPAATSSAAPVAPNGWAQQSDFVRKLFEGTWGQQNARKRWEAEHAAELKQNPPSYVAWQRGNPDKRLDYAPPDIRYAAWRASGSPDYNAGVGLTRMEQASNRYMPGGASVAARRAGALYPEGVASELAARRLSEQFNVGVDLARRLLQTEGWAPYRTWATGLANSGQLDYLFGGGWVEPTDEPAVARMVRRLGTERDIPDWIEELMRGDGR